MLQIHEYLFPSKVIFTLPLPLNQEETVMVRLRVVVVGQSEKKDDFLSLIKQKSSCHYFLK